MTPTLAPKPLKRAGVPPVCDAFFRPLGVLSLDSTCGGLCTSSNRCTVNQGSLSQTSSAIMGAGTVRSAPVCLSPPTAPLSGAILGTGRAVTLPCFGQGGHQFVNLVPQFCSILYRFCGHGRHSPYLITGFLILFLYFLGSNHQLGMSGPGVAIEISYGISNVLADSIEEMIFQVLLDL